ncbi:hypothetical protein CCC_01559 [Paramagnetospirillum magnetotacticum MS-1]|uniref:Uncharacterized protein n=1 Tax=Paramagnetospirillum magnetotacticum MS-1 TaxID=272627 RepID=A0A0C2YNL2_PARME|nr:hypothetical protein CCC_01559 [Paramagnetospirillum magnetotacticum MS-1]
MWAVQTLSGSSWHNGAIADFPAEWRQSENAVIQSAIAR